MNHNQDLLIEALQDATGSTSRNILDLWRLWLVAEGYTTGTVMDRLDRVARERGYTAMRLLQGHPVAVAAVLDSGPPTPAAPTIGTATRTASQTVSVTFTPSPTDGSLGVTGYTVTSIPGGLTGTGASSPISVAGLTNGTEYRFTAHATNVSGNSPESEQSNIAIPATVPGAPTALVATAGDGQASVSFTAPASNGGSVITSYTVTSSPGGITATAAGSPISVTGLTNNTDYNFTAKATNQYGDSAASSVSNFVTPIITPTGPFDNLYAPSWTPVTGTTIFTPPVLAQPAKSTGITSPSYTDSNYGTKIFRVSNLTDSPNNGSVKMRHEYSRKQAFNCDASKFMLYNSSSFLFVYDADTFTRLNGGITTNDIKLGGVGTNSIFPKDPRDWTWHATDPNKIIFKSTADDLNFYEFDVVTHALTTKFSFAGRLGALGMGSAVTVTTGGEGRPSDDGRYWGFMVQGSSGNNLGYISYDMQTDTILGSMLSTVGVNNVTMSPLGNYVCVSQSQNTLTYAQCAANSSIVGSRAYARDFSSFKQVSYTAGHSDVALDYLGREVWVSMSPNGALWSAIDDSDVFMIPLAGAEGPTALINVVDATSQWHSHYSGCAAPGRPGWMVFSAFDSEDRGARKYGDDNIMLIELKPAGAIYRLADHRTQRFTYWQEPHATASRDGLRIMYSCSWDSTSSSTPHLAYMIGLPSWIYGGTPPTNLLGNGIFTDSTGWSLGTSCTVTGGKLHCNNLAANVTNGYATTALPAGTYEVTFTLSDFNAGNVTMRIVAGSTVSGATRSAGVTPAGTYTDTITIGATSTAFEIRVTRQGATMDVKIDDITIVAV